MMKKTSLAALLSISAAFSTTAHAEGWVGYMNMFENNDGAAGAYIAGQSWGVPDLRTTVLTSSVGTYIGDQLFLEPNFNGYDSEDPAWSDGNGNGNRWLEANTYIEMPNISAPTASFAGTVDDYTLDPDYGAAAFIKVLNPNNGWSMDEFISADLSLAGSFALDADLTAHQGKILQYGFMVTGLNANPANGDLGGATVTVIPEPSTYALILAGASGLFLAIRRRRKSA